ncbi:hypothetical protein ACFYSI_12975 [Staphylococcus xylosus]|uniref:hypothetical protein n=1 Tax=Staphylococcus xylosus TaxID=1288 RepID=UPI0036926C24
MTEFEELNLDHIDLPDGSIVKIAILVTLSDDYLSDKSERKINRVWDIFAKSFGKSKDDYQAVEVTEVLQDEDPFKEKQNVFAIDLTSFGKIEPKKEKDLDFGLRLLQNNQNVLLIDDSMQDKQNVKNLDSGIEFNEVEEYLDDAYKYIKSLAETKRFEVLRDQKDENYNQRKLGEEKANTEKENHVVSAQEIIEKEEGETTQDEYSDTIQISSEELQPTSKSESDNVLTNTSNYSEEDSELEELDYEEDTEYYNEYDLENLKQKLLDNLDYYIPQYNLEELDNDFENLELESEDYQRLHQATLNALNNKTEQANKKLDVLRNKAINNLYRDLTGDLAKRYFEIEALYNYTVEGSEFNNIYQQLNNNLSEAQKNINIQADEKEKIKKQKHEKDKEIYLNNLLKKESARYDDDNLPKIKEEVENFKETSNDDVDNRYEEQMDLLREDIDRTVTERMDRLVYNIINDYTPQLNIAIEQLNETMQEELDKISQDNRKDWENYKDQLKDIEAVRTKEQNSQQSKIDEEVSNRTKHYEEIKRKLEENERHVDMLQSNLRKEKESNVQKDYSLDSASVERQQLLERFDKKELEVKKLEEQLKEKQTQLHQLGSSTNYLNYPLNRTPRTKVDKTKSKAKELYDSFEKLIIAFVASIIIGLAVLIAASIVSANQTDDAQSQQEAQKQEEQIKNQQQTLDDKQKELDDKQTQQEEKQKELDKQAKENEKNKSSKDK